MSPKNVGNKSKAATAHIGGERGDLLTQAAIDLSATARRQITGSQFLKFIIDNYTEAAKAALLEQLLNEQRVPSDD